MALGSIRSRSILYFLHSRNISVDRFWTKNLTFFFSFHTSVGVYHCLPYNISFLSLTDKCQQQKHITPKAVRSKQIVGSTYSLELNLHDAQRNHESSHVSLKHSFSKKPTFIILCVVYLKQEYEECAETQRNRVEARPQIIVARPVQG